MPDIFYKAISAGTDIKILSVATDNVYTGRCVQSFHHWILS
jgi:hypothetical protein